MRILQENHEPAAGQEGRRHEMWPEWIRNGWVMPGLPGLSALFFQDRVAGGHPAAAPRNVFTEVTK